MTVSGYLGKDQVCIGHYGTYEEFTDNSTTVCMTDQSFLLVNSISGSNWDMRATDMKYVDSVCGLGKEVPSAEATGWLARAVYEGNLK